MTSQTKPMAAVLVADLQSLWIWMNTFPSSAENRGKVSVWLEVAVLSADCKVATQPRSFPILSTLMTTSNISVRWEVLCGLSARTMHQSHASRSHGCS